MKRLILIAALGLAGCADTVTLRNAAGMTATCSGSVSYSDTSETALARQRTCVMDFQRQGYERAAK